MQAIGPARQQARSRRGRADALAARMLTEIVSYLAEHPEADERLVSDAISILMENLECLPDRD